MSKRAMTNMGTPAFGVDPMFQPPMQGMNPMIQQPMPGMNPMIEQNIGFPQSCCKRPQCPTIFKTCPPVVTCSKQVLDQYHITKQPLIHNFHTEVVHHHITENEFTPTFSCSEVHVQHPQRRPNGPFGF